MDIFASFTMMDTADQKILNNYLGLIEQLNPAMKMSLIDELTASLKSVHSDDNHMQDAFGAWSSEESAEDLVALLRNSRNTNRQIEEL